MGVGHSAAIGAILAIATNYAMLAVISVENTTMVARMIQNAVLTDAYAKVGTEKTRLIEPLPTHEKLNELPPLRSRDERRRSACEYAELWHQRLPWSNRFARTDLFNDRTREDGSSFQMPELRSFG